ncbi:excinuclease, partial [Vibrio anguillarum]|nr:excinuclease [Vibrio anguillarum]
GGFSAKLKFSVYSVFTVCFLSSAVRCQPLSRALCDFRHTCI